MSQSQSPSPEVQQRRSRSPLRAEEPRSPPRTQSLPTVMVNYSRLRYKFVAGKRINSEMLHTLDEGQLYRFRVNLKAAAQYDCYLAHCPAKVQINLDTKVCSRKGDATHNHGRNDQIEVIQLKDTIKKRCRSAAAVSRRGGNVRETFNATILE